jgi:hypothetical protein
MTFVLALITALAACSRSDSDSEASSEEETGEDAGGETSGSGDGRIAAGEFGDLGTVCQDGEASGASDTGLTDGEIRLGTITDKGSDVRQGLNKEMYDTAVAFAEWCNEHGGINGRALVVDDLDARLTEYPQRIEEACRDDFALVGGGAVFDNADNGARVACGLPNVAGYVVTPEARVADLQVQPVPNPVQQFPVQQYLRMQEEHPDATNYGVLWVDLAGVKTVHDQFVEAVETLGFDVVYDQTYAPIGETGWRNFVQTMRDRGVQGFELVGEPENMTALLGAMQTEGWYPDFITLQPNMYEQRFEDEAGASVGDAEIYVRSAFPTFDMADDVPAMADYIELMETYNPDGKYPAALGAQALSSWLLFAQAATECGDDLSRTCVIENAAAVTDWTAGGLHAPSTPGNAQAIACSNVIQFTPDGFQYNEEVTAPDQGIYNCSPDNVLELTGDYGVTPPEE